MGLAKMVALPVEVLIFGENGLTNGTPVVSESTGTTTTSTSSSVDVTEFYPTDMNAADNLSNYPKPHECNVV